ncbi:hypothetical protein AY599_28120 [Leptolyngbya valderiana BDU 20041]|nr:hypothetical protein AY599_28120 [Leptolyngbya valderiana BDU 20041]
MRSNGQPWRGRDGRPGRIARRVAIALAVGALLAIASVPAGTGVRLARESRTLSAGAWPMEQGSAYVMVYWELDPAGTRHERVFVVAHDGQMNIHPSTLENAGVPGAVRGEIRSRYAGYDVFWGGFPFTAAVGWRVQEFATGQLIPNSSPQAAGPYRRAWLASDDPAYGYADWAIPVRPLWPGLLGNIVVYAAGVLLLLTLPRWWRRYVRRWEGRCAACGYELGEGVSTCPECGLIARA